MAAAGFSRRSATRDVSRAQDVPAATAQQPHRHPAPLKAPIRFGLYPGRQHTRNFMPGSLATSTRILRNPSLGLGAGFRRQIDARIPRNTGIGPQITLAVIVNSVLSSDVDTAVWSTAIAVQQVGDIGLPAIGAKIGPLPK